MPHVKAGSPRHRSGTQDLPRADSGRSVAGGRKRIWASRETWRELVQTERQAEKGTCISREARRKEGCKQGGKERGGSK